jgi:DNA-directed RNA polymerase subunit RPC12/RpoP
MKFKCSNCSKEWVVPKDKLVHMSDWPDTCPKCGSADIGHEKFEKVMASSVVLECVNDRELEDIERRKLEKCFKASRKEEVKK